MTVNYNKTGNKPSKPNIMGRQDKTRGDSKAERTAVVSFSTTPDLHERIKDAAHLNRMNKSRFIELALEEYLNSLELGDE